MPFFRPPIIKERKFNIGGFLTTKFKLVLWETWVNLSRPYARLSTNSVFRQGSTTSMIFSRLRTLSGCTVTTSPICAGNLDYDNLCHEAYGVGEPATILEDACKTYPVVGTCLWTE
jgi:hypothetical protein